MILQIKTTKNIIKNGYIFYLGVLDQEKQIHCLISKKKQDSDSLIVEIYLYVRDLIDIEY